MVFMKYFLDSDGDGHWYIVEAARRDEWNAWCDLNPEDPRAWDVPPFARAIGGHPSQIEFILPL